MANFPGPAALKAAIVWNRRALGRALHQNRATDADRHRRNILDLEARLA